MSNLKSGRGNSSTKSRAPKKMSVRVYWVSLYRVIQKKKVSSEKVFDGSTGDLVCQNKSSWFLKPVK